MINKIETLLQELKITKNQKKDFYKVRNKFCEIRSRECGSRIDLHQSDDYKHV